MSQAGGFNSFYLRPSIWGKMRNIFVSYTWVSAGIRNFGQAIFECEDIDTSGVGFIEWVYRHIYKINPIIDEGKVSILNYKVMTP